MFIDLVCDLQGVDPAKFDGAFLRFESLDVFPSPLVSNFFLGGVCSFFFAGFVPRVKPIGGEPQSINGTRIDKFLVFFPSKYGCEIKTLAPPGRAAALEFPLAKALC